MCSVLELCKVFCHELLLPCAAVDTLHYLNSQKLYNNTGKFSILKNVHIYTLRSLFLAGIYLI